MGIRKHKTKKGIRYQAELNIKGRIIATKRGFLTKKEARYWLRGAEDEYRNALKKQPTGTGYRALANAYLDDVNARYKPNTFSYKRAVLRRFRAFMSDGDFSIEDITHEHIDRFALARREAAGAKAANRDIRELKAFLNWGIRKNMVQTNPFRTFEPFSEEQYVRPIPTAEEVNAVRLAAQGEERDFIEVLYFTAARLSEVCGLTWDDVNLESRTIVLWTSKRRGGFRQPRKLAVTPTLYTILKRRWETRKTSSPYVFFNPSSEDGRFHRNSRFVKYLFERVCARAEVEKFTAHAIRHHVASVLADSRKATHYQIKNLLGHQRTETTDKYLHELSVDHEIGSVLESPPMLKLVKGNEEK